MVLKDKHVLIVGGTKRIGLALAERAVAEKARVSVTYRTTKNTNPSVFAVQADLKKIDTIALAVSDATSKQGPVDILINSASQFYPTPALSCKSEQWNELFESNIKGQFFFAQAVASAMLKGTGGVVINIADVNAEHPIRNFTPYLAAKAALLQMTRSLALEWAPKIRVNAISPGPVLIPEGFTEEQKARAIESTLLKRLGSPNDIVEGIFFLIRNDYMTGFNLVVDGGYSGRL
jgi:pteridine reductase